MAHIATKYNSYTEFYLSRFIRIFAPYYFVLIIVVIASIASGILFDYWGMMDNSLRQYEMNGVLGIIVASITNVTILFQDWIMFMADDVNNYFSFTTDFRTSRYPLYNYLLIPQAWSIGVELTFYLIVPLLNRQKSKYLFIIIIISLLSRIVAAEYFNLKNDPWTYRFFPFEIALFVLGMLSNRLYHKVYCKKNNSSGADPFWRYIFYVCIIFILIILSKKITLASSAYLGKNYAELLSYVVWSMCLPIAFFFLKDIKYDRFVGELSYPIYLIHLAVILYLRKVMNFIGVDYTYLVYVSSAVTILFSVILYYYLIRPIDNLRHSISVNNHHPAP